ncbi:MAG TPA: hypothetical protein VF375_03080 [Candidatus Limnocylindrales bacterium]
MSKGHERRANRETQVQTTTTRGISQDPQGEAPNSGSTRDPAWAGWSRIIEVENARLLRYRRPVAVVMAVATTTA